MMIDRIYFPVKSLGYGERVGLWTVGCPHRCYNCSNAELWDIDSTKEIPLNKIMDLILNIDKQVDGITITGGEPFIQYHELSKLVRLLNQVGVEDILIYTGYTLNQLIEMNIKDIDEILDSISVLIDGKYVDKLNDNKALRGSSNQNINILNPRFKRKYDYLQTQNRKVQNVFYSNKLMTIGIPNKNFRKNMNSKLLEYGIKSD